VPREQLASGKVLHIITIIIIIIIFFFFFFFFFFFPTRITAGGRIF